MTVTAQVLSAARESVEKEGRLLGIILDNYRACPDEDNQQNVITQMTAYRHKWMHLMRVLDYPVVQSEDFKK